MEKRILSLISKDCKKVNASLIIEDYPQPFVELQSEIFSSERIECEKIFYGFQELHKKLDALGLKLLCQGYRYDVWPSGMGLSMGHGIRAYKCRLGETATELVDIFEAADDEEAVVTYEEQRDYRRRWIDSLK